MDLRTLVPLDEDTVMEQVRSHGPLLVVTEEHHQQLRWALADPSATSASDWTHQSARWLSGHAPSR